MPSRTKSKMCMSYIVLINILIAVQYFLLLGERVCDLASHFKVFKSGHASARLVMSKNLQKSVVYISHHETTASFYNNEVIEQNCSTVNKLKINELNRKQTAPVRPTPWVVSAVSLVWAPSQETVPVDLAIPPHHPFHLQPVLHLRRLHPSALPHPTLARLPASKSRRNPRW